MDLYKGGGKDGHFFLYPTTPGQGVQPCTFCAGAPAAGAPAAQTQAKPAVEVASTGAITSHAKVTVSDGRKTVDDPFSKDSFTLVEQRGGNIQRAPYYRVTPGKKYTLTVENKTSRPVDNEGVRIAGPDFEATVRGLKLAPGQSVRIRIASDGRTLVFRSNRALDTSTISIGRTETGVDHDFVLERDSVLQADTRLVLHMDPTSDKLNVSGAPGTYDLLARRVDAAGEKVLVRNDVNTSSAPGGGDDVTFDYEEWDGSPGSFIRLDGDGGQGPGLESQVPADTPSGQAEQGVTGQAPGQGDAGGGDDDDDDDDG